MSLQRTSETSADALAAKSLLCQLLANLRQHLDRRVNLEKVVDVLGFAIFRAMRRLWIPLVILVVVGAGGLTVARLHGIFGSEKLLSYGDTKVDTKPFNPKHIEIRDLRTPGDGSRHQLFRCQW